MGGTLQAPFGEALLRVTGVVVIGIGASQVWRGLFGNVRRDWRLGALDPARRRWAFRVGRFGLATRGLVLGVAGFLLIRAAAALDPEEAGGVGDVLARLGAQPASPWLLGGVALGLVAYGAFALIEARYRFIPSV